MIAKFRMLMNIAAPLDDLRFNRVRGLIDLRSQAINAGGHRKRQQKQAENEHEFHG
jgi:hypothetical protein